MSQQLISRSVDLRRLRDEGYEVEISSSNFLLIHNIPYVNGRREIARGILGSELTMTGDVTAPPSTHVGLFIGEHPCNKDGSEIAAIKHAASSQLVGSGLVARFSFSNKPPAGYRDYYDKMIRYIEIISSPARSIDPTATARTYRAIESDGSDSPFTYLDTASSRAGIAAVTQKLANQEVGIVGLGGTGSYILDLVAKTPVRAIHIFDSDTFLQHNAFRAPGAASLDELRAAPKKVDYFRSLYSKIHKGVVAHPHHVDESNTSALDGMTFVFICIDKGSVKQHILAKLEESGIPFIDVGMGIELVPESNSLIGVLRVTAATDSMRNHVREKKRISFADDDGGAYAQNIQIADLNALNAALAVVRWKRFCGFYQDLVQEHHSTYSINVNLLTSDDSPA